MRRSALFLRFDSAIHGARSGYPPAHLAAYFPGRDGRVSGARRFCRSHSLSADRARLQRQSGPERPHPRRAGDRGPVHVPPGDPALPRNPLGQFADRGPDRRRPYPGPARADGGDAQRRGGRAGPLDHHHPRNPRLHRHPARRGARTQPLSGRPFGVSRPARHVLGPPADSALNRRRHRQHEDRGQIRRACSTLSKPASPPRSLA